MPKGYPKSGKRSSSTFTPEWRAKISAAQKARLKTKEDRYALVQRCLTDNPRGRKKIVRLTSDGKDCKYSRMGRQSRGTPSELRLFNAIKHLGFTQQYKVRTPKPRGYYSLDLLHNLSGLVIEVDGSFHDLPERKEYDSHRDQYLESIGLS